MQLMSPKKSTSELMVWVLMMVRGGLIIGIKCRVSFTQTNAGVFLRTLITPCVQLTGASYSADYKGDLSKFSGPTL